ncbi:hypothetical protein Tco_0588054 [Tanacetum coccineum]
MDYTRWSDDLRRHQLHLLLATIQTRFFQGLRHWRQVTPLPTGPSLWKAISEGTSRGDFSGRVGYKRTLVLDLIPEPCSFRAAQNWSKPANRAWSASRSGDSRSWLRSCLGHSGDEKALWLQVQWVLPLGPHPATVYGRPRQVRSRAIAQKGRIYDESFCSSGDSSTRICLRCLSGGASWE